LTKVVEYLIGGHHFTLQEAAAFGMAGTWAILDRKSKGATDLEAVFTPSWEFENIVRQSYGLHLVIDFENLWAEAAANHVFIDGLMNGIPKSVGMEILFPAKTLYYDGGKDHQDSGVTSIVGLTTSHASIHLYDKKRVGYFDLFSCKHFDPAEVIKVVTKSVGCTMFDVQVLVRGKHLGRGK
jgi:S-adenosylmethionine decarboxylase